MKKLMAIVFILCAAVNAVAQEPAAPSTEHYNSPKSGLAVKGYDPVSYHQAEANKGSAQFTSTYNGLRYRFVSEANRSAFQADPARFEPAYGGWCAWAMLEGEKVDINPQRFKIIGGRTYLFYDGFFGNTLKKWHKKTEKIPELKLVETADQHWKKLTMP